MSSNVEDDLNLFDEKKKNDEVVGVPTVPLPDSVEKGSGNEEGKEAQNKILKSQDETAKEYEPMIHLLVGDIGN